MKGFRSVALVDEYPITVPSKYDFEPSDYWWLPARPESSKFPKRRKTFKANKRKANR